MKELVPLQLMSTAFAGRTSTRELEDSAGRVWLAAGLVSLWGKIIEAERGWRAEFAYPRLIWLLPPIQRLAPPQAESDARTAQTLVALLRKSYWQPVFGPRALPEL